MALEEFAPGIWLQQGLAEGFPTVAGVVLTEAHAIVIDTLTSPRDMDPVMALLRERAGLRRVLVVNTHHHWDHVYGNACFATADIVSHAACRRLLLSSPGEDSSPPRPPEGLVLPNVTFTGDVIVSDVDETVHLMPAPGHSEDSIIVFLERRGVLFGGDAVEWPLPSFGIGSDVDAWLGTIRELRALGAELIIPSHGPVMDATLLDANERYMESLLAAVAAGRRRGLQADELELAAEDFVAPGVVLSDVSLASHAANVAWLWREASPAE